MLLPAEWATPEDFATLFQYFWHRDFPIDPRAVEAKRSDWTIHIGIVVRNIADLMGLHARFESGHRKDVVLRSTIGDEIAIEWEWEGVWGNELDKLKKHKLWSKDKDPERPLKYAVLITYREIAKLEDIINHVGTKWSEAKWPLLLILIYGEVSEVLTSGREFIDIQMSLFDTSGHRSSLRVAPAYPWKVEGTRWSAQTPSSS